MKKWRLPVALAGVTAVGLALAGCAPTTTTGAQSSTGDETATVFISGDTNVQDLWEKGIIPAFEKANPGTKITTTIDLHGEHDAQTIAKLTTATTNGDDPGFDLVDASFVTGAAASAGLLMPVSAADIPNLANVPETTVAAGATVGIPYRASSVLLAYDTTKVSTPPTTLAGLLDWIKQNPGQFTYNSPSSGGSGSAFVTTVLDSTISAADRDKMTVGYAQDLESEWDAGFATLAGLNPYVYQQGVYPNGNTQVLDLLGSGQVAMAPVWSDQVITAQANGQLPDTVAYTQISDPSLTGSASYLGIPKTSTHSALALKLADFVLSADGQQIVASQISGYPVVSLDTLPTDVAAKFSAAHPDQLRPTYFSQLTADMSNLWDQKVPGQ